MVASLPAGTRFISASTSRGAGMTTVPLPRRELTRGVVFSTRGRLLSSASFWHHDLRVLILRRIGSYRPWNLPFQAPGRCYRSVSQGRRTH